MYKYRQIKVLGKGGFGSAILVTDRDNPKQQRVVKEVNLAGMGKKEQEDACREATFLRTLNHPNIVGYVESFMEAGKLYIVMEFADGGDLSGRIAALKKARQWMTEEEALNIFVQICLALKHMHARHIIHRDLKAANVFLMKSGIVKLGDLGIARALANSADLAKTQIGTPYYLSPELCCDKPYGKKTDIYSAGVVLYECLALALPFTAPDLPRLVTKILTGVYAELPPRYSGEVRALVRSLLARDPRDRPTVTALLRTDLLRDRMSRFLTKTLEQREFGQALQLAAAGADKPAEVLASQDVKRVVYAAGGVTPMPAAMPPPQRRPSPVPLHPSTPVPGSSGGGGGAGAPRSSIGASVAAPAAAPVSGVALGRQPARSAGSNVSSSVSSAPPAPAVSAAAVAAREQERARVLEAQKLLEAQHARAAKLEADRARANALALQHAAAAISEERRKRLEERVERERVKMKERSERAAAILGREEADKKKRAVIAKQERERWVAERRKEWEAAFQERRAVAGNETDGGDVAVAGDDAAVTVLLPHTALVTPAPAPAPARTPTPVPVPVPASPSLGAHARVRAESSGGESPVPPPPAATPSPLPLPADAPRVPDSPVRRLEAARPHALNAVDAAVVEAHHASPSERARDKPGVLLSPTPASGSATPVASAGGSRSDELRAVLADPEFQDVYAEFLRNKAAAGGITPTNAAAAAAALASLAPPRNGAPALARGVSSFDAEPARDVPVGQQRGVMSPPPPAPRDAKAAQEADYLAALEVARKAYVAERRAVVDRAKEERSAAAAAAVAAARASPDRGSRSEPESDVLVRERARARHEAELAERDAALREAARAAIADRLAAKEAARARAAREAEEAAAEAAARRRASSVCSEPDTVSGAPPPSSGVASLKSPAEAREAKAAAAEAREAALREAAREAFLERKRLQQLAKAAAAAPHEDARAGGGEGGDEEVDPSVVIFTAGSRKAAAAAAAEEAASVAKPRIPAFLARRLASHARSSAGASVPDATPGSSGAASSFASGVGFKPSVASASALPHPCVSTASSPPEHALLSPSFSSPTGEAGESVRASEGGTPLISYTKDAVAARDADGRPLGPLQLAMMQRRTARARAGSSDSLGSVGEREAASVGAQPGARASSAAAPGKAAVSGASAASPRIPTNGARTPSASSIAAASRPSLSKSGGAGSGAGSGPVAVRTSLADIRRSSAASASAPSSSAGAPAAIPPAGRASLVGAAASRQRAGVPSGLASPPLLSPAASVVSPTGSTRASIPRPSRTGGVTGSGGVTPSDRRRLLTTAKAAGMMSSIDKAQEAVAAAAAAVAAPPRRSISASTPTPGRSARVEGGGEASGGKEGDDAAGRAFAPQPARSSSRNSISSRHKAAAAAGPGSDNVVSPTYAHAPGAQPSVAAVDAAAAAAAAACVAVPALPATAGAGAGARTHAGSGSSLAQSDNLADTFALSMTLEGLSIADAGVCDLDASVHSAPGLPPVHSFTDADDEELVRMELDVAGMKEELQRALELTEGDADEEEEEEAAMAATGGRDPYSDMVPSMQAIAACLEEASVVMSELPDMVSLDDEEAEGEEEEEKEEDVAAARFRAHASIDDAGAHSPPPTPPPSSSVISGVSTPGDDFSPSSSRDFRSLVVSRDGHVVASGSLVLQHSMASDPGDAAAE